MAWKFINFILGSIFLYFQKSNFRNCVLIDELDSDLAFTFAKNGIFTLSIFTNCQDYCERVTKHLTYLESIDNNSAGRIVSLHASTNQFEHINIFECILTQSPTCLRGMKLRNGVQVVSRIRMTVALQQELNLHLNMLHPLLHKDCPMFIYTNDDNNVVEPYNNGYQFQTTPIDCHHSYVYFDALHICSVTNTRQIIEYLKAEEGYLERKNGGHASRNSRLKNPDQIELNISSYHDICDEYFSASPSSVGNHVFSKVECIKQPIDENILVKIVRIFDCEADVPTHIPSSSLICMQADGTKVGVMDMKSPFSFICECPTGRIKSSTDVFLDYDDINETCVTFKVTSGKLSLGCEVFLQGTDGVQIFNECIANNGWVFGDFLYFNPDCTSFPSNYVITVFHDMLMGRSLRIKKDVDLKQWGLFYVGESIIEKGVGIICFSGKQLSKRDWMVKNSDDKFQRYSFKTKFYSEALSDLEFYIDTWNYGSEARFMNHNCRGNVEIVLQDSGYLYVIASHNIHPNTFLEFNYFGVGENNVCECTDLPFQVSCTFEAAPP